MLTYEQWNQAIISYFFENHDETEVVFLHITPEVLQELAEQFKLNVEAAVESLKSAVINQVIPYWRVNLRQIYPTDLWEANPETEPPQVAFLALTVLAASMMRSSEGASHTNYYVRLNQLLFDEPRRGIPQGIQYWEWERFWKHLKRWARHQHDIELYLTEGPSNRRYVWYPISQSLISKHDLPSIYRFFERNKLHPFSNLSDDQLLDKLRSWASPSKLSARIRRHLDKEHYAQLIASQVQLLLKNWDGHVLETPERSHRKAHASAPISVQLLFDPFGNAEIRYWFPRRGRDEIDLDTNAWGINHLKPSDSEKWFEPIGDDRGTFWTLRHRRQLQTNETKPITCTLDPGDIWVFREDPERDDGWLSQRNLQLYEDHLIVFRHRLSQKATDCLKKVCSEEIKIPNPIRVGGQKNGWLYLRVKPVKLLDVSDPELWKLSVDYRKRIRLIDGLSVKNQHGHRDYLDICLPTVFVPDLGLSDSEPLRVGELVFTVGEDRLVALDNKLEPGVHQLSYGGKQLELRVISPECLPEPEKRPLIFHLKTDGTEMQVDQEKVISELASQPRLWLAGAEFFGMGVPPTTWDDVETEPEIQEDGPHQLLKSPAELISSVVRVAIDLKQDTAPVPEWLDKAIELLDQNIALRALVQKKLSLYRKTALSYAELRNWGGSRHGRETISRR